VDAGVSPPLIWMPTDPAPEALLQLAGNDLSLQAELGTAARRCPVRQSGNQPIFLTSDRDGGIYVEDDSNYRLKQYGRIPGRSGRARAQKWALGVLSNILGLRATRPGDAGLWNAISVTPEEPLFIDSIFVRTAGSTGGNGKNGGGDPAVSTAPGADSVRRHRDKCPVR